MPKKKQRKDPRVGSTFKRWYKRKMYTLTVVRHEGALWYEVGGNRYRSPSAAAKAVTRTSVNGWRFWRMD
jgi:hypothetical protein